MARELSARWQTFFIRAYGLLLWLNLGNSAIIALTARHEGFDFMAITLISFGGIGVSTITDIAASVIADKGGRKAVLITAPLLMTCGTVIVLCTHSRTFFVLGAIVMVGSTTVAGNVPEAIIKEVAGDDQRRHDVSTHVYGVCRKLSPIFGPLLGGSLALEGPKLPFLCEILPLALSFMAALLLRKDQDKAAGKRPAVINGFFLDTLKKTWADKPMRAYFMFGMGLKSYWSVLDYLTGLFCLSRGGTAQQVGMFAAAVSTGWWLANVLVAWLVKRKEGRKTPLKLIPVAAACLWLALALPGWWSMALYAVEVFIVGVIVSTFECERQWQIKTGRVSTQLSIFDGAVRLAMLPITLAFSWLAAMLGTNLAYATTCGVGLVVMGLARRTYVAVR